MHPQQTLFPIRGVQTFGISGPHWKKSCLGPPIKYIVTCNHKNYLIHVLSKFTVLCLAALIAPLGCVRPEGHRVDAPDYTMFLTQRALLTPLAFQLRGRAVPKVSISRCTQIPVSPHHAEISEIRVDLSRLPVAVHG